MLKKVEMTPGFGFEIIGGTGLATLRAGVFGVPFGGYLQVQLVGLSVHVLLNQLPWRFQAQAKLHDVVECHGAPLALIAPIATAMVTLCL